MMIDYRAFQPLTLICWTVAACSIIVANLVTVGPAAPAFWLVLVLISCQIAGYLYYRHKWPNSVWRPGAPAPLVDGGRWNRPATNAHLQAALKRQTWQVIAWCAVLTIAGAATWIMFALSA